MQYLKFVEILKNEKTFENFYSLMKHKVGYEISEFRALEFVLKVNNSGTNLNRVN